MSPPGFPLRPEQGTSGRALPPRAKMLLATAIVLIGSASAFPFRKDNSVSPIPPVPDQASLRSLQPVGADVLPTVFKEPTAAVAAGVEKYAAAYPEPALRTENAIAASTDGADGTIVREISVPYREFRSLPATSGAGTTFLERNSTAFGDQPAPVDQAAVVDGMLPMFYAADNLKPLSKGNETTLPENPFETNPTALLSQQVLTVVGTEGNAQTPKLTSLKPFVELKSLKLPQ